MTLWLPFPAPAKSAKPIILPTTCNGVSTSQTLNVRYGGFAQLLILPRCADTWRRQRRPLFLPQLFGLCSLALMRPAAFWHFGPPSINSSLCTRTLYERPTSKPLNRCSSQGSTSTYGRRTRNPPLPISRCTRWPGKGPSRNIELLPVAELQPQAV